MSKKRDITNIFVTYLVTEEKKEENKSGQLRATITTAVVTTVVKDVLDGLKNAMPYIQQTLLAIGSCFCPAGAYVPNIPPVEDYRQEARALHTPDYFPMDGFKPSFAEQFAGN